MQSKYRKCEMCEETKELEQFANAGTNKGNKYYRHKCIPCYSKFKMTRKWAQRQRFLEYKKTMHCISCGNSDHRVLEFHHRDPSQKEREVSLMMDHSWANVEAEIAKCDCLCANCHRILHYEERNNRNGD